MFFSFNPIRFLTGLLRLNWTPTGERVYFKTEEEDGRTFFYFFSGEMMFMYFFRHFVSGECVLIILGIEKDFDDVQLIYEIVKAAIRVVADDQPVRLGIKVGHVTEPFSEALLLHEFFLNPNPIYYTVDDDEVCVLMAYKPSKDEWSKLSFKKK